MKLLQSRAYHFTFAHNENEAIDLLRKEQFDLVITNMILEEGMPLLGGLEVLDTVRKLQLETVCMVLTECENYQTAVRIHNEYRDIVVAIIPKSDPWVDAEGFKLKVKNALSALSPATQVSKATTGLKGGKEQANLADVRKSSLLQDFAGITEGEPTGDHTNQKIDINGSHTAQATPRHITWLHISDLHFRSSQYAADVVLEQMIDHVRAQVKVHDLRLDFIVVTGDVAFSGLPKEYKRAEAFFNDLLTATGVNKERLFIIPGNHDVHWKSIHEITAAGYLTTLTTTDKIDEVLGSRTHLKAILAKFRYYKQFIKRYLPFRPCDEKHLYFVETLPLCGKRVSILGLNSAWMSAYKWKKKDEKADDRHQLILGRRQLRLAHKEAKQQEADLLIAAMHHPTEWLKDKVDREEIEALLERHCHFILRGHLHNNTVLGSTTPGSHDATYTITAGASFQTRGHPMDYNGYNFVRLDLDAGIGTIHLRCYSSKYGGHWTEDGYSYPGLPDGGFSFALPETLLS